MKFFKRLICKCFGHSYRFDKRSILHHRHSKEYRDYYTCARCGNSHYITTVKRK